MPGGDSTHVGSKQNPPQPLLTALDVGDSDDSLPKLYSPLKDCWDLSMASKHTPGTSQLSPQHPSRQLKQKVAALFFSLGENHRHEIIIKNPEVVLPLPARAQKKQLQVRFNLPSLCNHKAANWVLQSKVLQHLSGRLRWSSPTLQFPHRSRMENHNVLKITREPALGGHNSQENKGPAEPSAPGCWQVGLPRIMVAIPIVEAATTQETG